MPEVDAPIRNVDFDPSVPVDSWGPEVIEIVLDRGSLSDWRLLAHEIIVRPWGRVARRVAEVVSWSEHYGVDALMDEVISRARERIDERGRARYAALLRSRRLAVGLTQRELAAMAGTSESRLSAYENAAVAPTTTVMGRIEEVLDVFEQQERR
jgi:DNA-binding transcriptional regulator YiaG